MAKTSTGKKAAATTDAAPVVSTPVVKTTGKSAASLLGALTGKPVAKKSAAKTERPEVEMSDLAQALFVEFAPAVELAKVFEAHAENLKGQLSGEVFSQYVKTMWQNKSQPTNPAMKADDCEAIMVVQEKIKVQIPNPEDPIESVVALLVKSGTSEAVARKIVENEIDFSPTVGLRPFTELVSGHYEERQFIEASAAEQAVAQKILEFVTNELSDEERDIVLKNEAGTVVKKGFLERVATYVSGEAELNAVFKVLTPTYYPKGAKFAVGDTPVNKTNRLIAKASEILGTATDE